VRAANAGDAGRGGRGRCGARETGDAARCGHARSLQRRNTLRTRETRRAADAGDTARGRRGRSSVLPGKLAPGKVVPRTSWMKTAVRELTLRRESFHRSSIDSHHCLRRGFGAWRAARRRHGSRQMAGARESEAREMRRAGDGRRSARRTGETLCGSGRGKSLYRGNARRTRDTGAADAGDAARGGRGRCGALRTREITVPGKLAPGKVVPRTSWMKTADGS
jgi:hypothetical protein